MNVLQNKATLNTNMITFQEQFYQQFDHYNIVTCV